VVEQRRQVGMAGHMLGEGLRTEQCEEPLT
jgi:hypothetical protein